MLTNNEIKDITKIIHSFKIRGILLNGTTKNITSQKGGLLFFFWSFDESWFTINERSTHTFSLKCFGTFTIKDGSVRNRCRVGNKINDF